MPSCLYNIIIICTIIILTTLGLFTKVIVVNYEQETGCNNIIISDVIPVSQDIAAGVYFLRRSWRS